jgi:hypothetical protein
MGAHACRVSLHLMRVHLLLAAVTAACYDARAFADLQGVVEAVMVLAEVDADKASHDTHEKRFEVKRHVG